jgi:hypothetical protein
MTEGKMETSEKKNVLHLGDAPGIKAAIDEQVVEVRGGATSKPQR